MSAFLVFAALLLAGAVWAQRLPQAASIADHLNWWVLYVALPAMVLELVPRLHVDAHLWYLVGAQWLGFVLTIAVFVPVGRALRWSRQRLAGVLLMGSLNNTAFVGIPLVGALRGDGALPMVAIADQLGCFVALSTGGAALVANFRGEPVDLRGIARNMLRFPPFIALLVAVPVLAFGGWPSLVGSGLHRIAATLAPITLFSVGLRLRLVPVPGQRSALLLVLGWKLLAMPLVAWLVGLALGVRGLPFTVAVLETAMPPMFTTAIIARANGFDPDFTDKVLSLGLLLSFVTVPAWALLLP